MAALCSHLVLAGPPRGHPSRPTSVWDTSTSSAPASVALPEQGWSGYGRLSALLEPVFEARLKNKELQQQAAGVSGEKDIEDAHAKSLVERVSDGRSPEEKGEFGEKVVEKESKIWTDDVRFPRRRKEWSNSVSKTPGKRRLGKVQGKRGQPWESGLTDMGDSIFRQILQTSEEESVGRYLNPASSRLSIRELLSMIKSFGKEGQWTKALQVFNWMKRNEKLKPDGATIAVMLRILGQESQLSAATQLFESLKVEGYTLDVYAYTSLISALSRSREFKEALVLFERMKEEGPQPSLVTYNVIIALYGKKGRSWDNILALFTEMKLCGIQPDEYTYNTAITACAGGALCDEAKSLFAQMKAAKCMPDRVTYNALLDVYGKAGWHMEALNVLKEMENASCPPNIVTYNELLSAFGRAGLLSEAAAMKETMVDKGFEPDVFTYTSLLSAYSRAGRVKQAMDIYEEMREKGCTPNLFTFNALIDIHGKKKKFNEMMEMFEDMQVTLLPLEPPGSLPVFVWDWNTCKYLGT